MNKPEGMALRGNDVVPPGGGRVAVLVPCFNEEAAVATVVADFRAALPQATIHVYDNNSTDRTAEVARAAGAWCAGKPTRVRAMWCGECFPTWMRTSTCWSMATPPMMRPVPAP